MQPLNRGRDMVKKAIAGLCVVAAFGIAAAAANECGTAPYVSPQDPDKVVASLPEAARQAYSGHNYPVMKSQWSSWKAKSAKVTVGMSFAQPVDDFSSEIFDTIKADLEADPRVAKVIAVRGASGKDIPGQIQQYQSLVAQQPDLMIANVRAGEAFVGPVEAAAKKGIPTIAVMTVIPTAYAVTIVPNTYLAGAETLGAVMKGLGGKGNVLLVHGIPGLSIDRAAFDAFNAVLARCPEAKAVGEVTGGFSPAQAKAAVLKFLGTHPQKVDAIASVGAMAAGIISAFQQAGRPVPPLAEGAALKGFLAYWHQNRASYRSSATGAGGIETGHLFAAVAKRMLAGGGPKLSAIVLRQPLIGMDNLMEWTDPSWTLDTPGHSQGPAGYYRIDQTLAPLFNNPAK